MSTKSKPNNKKTFYKYLNIGNICIDNLFKYSRDIDKKEVTKPIDFLSTNDEFLKKYNDQYKEIIKRFKQNHTEYSFAKKYDNINYKIIFNTNIDYYDRTYDNCEIQVYVELSREESDEEYNNRLQREENQRLNNKKSKLKAKKTKEEKELEEFKKLAKKFKNKLPEILGEN